MNRFLLIAILVLAVSGIPSLSWTADQAGARQTAADEQRTRDEKSMEERFRRLGRDLDELNARAATMEKQARKDLDRNLAEAEKKREAAGKKLEAMKAEGKKKWHALAADVRAALDDFEKAYNRAKEHLKE